MKRYKDFIVESKSDLWTYEGDFRVAQSMIIDGKFIKDEIPDIVKGEFDCSRLNLKSLEGCPIEIGYGFYCNFNQLTSLKGCPTKIGTSFNCNNNQLTSLKYCPNIINDYFDCTFNPNLISLEDYPKKIKDEGYLFSDLRIESNFIELGKHINDYWEDLLKYMITENIDLSEVKGWPEGFLTKETIKSAKGISKFNL